MRYLWRLRRDRYCEGLRDRSCALCKYTDQAFQWTAEKRKTRRISRINREKSNGIESITADQADDYFGMYSTDTVLFPCHAARMISYMYPSTRWFEMRGISNTFIHTCEFGALVTSTVIEGQGSEYRRRLLELGDPDEDSHR